MNEENTISSSSAEASPLAPTLIAILTQAMSLHRQGELESAEQMYIAALDLEPKSFDALHMLGVLHLNRGNFVAAVNFIKAAQKIYPTSASASLNLGLAFRNQNLNEEALACYDRAIELAPDFSAAHYNRGNLLRDLRRGDEAVSAYVIASRCLPEFVDAHFNCGRVLADLGCFDDATIRFDHAIALQPDHIEAHFNRAYSLIRLHRYEEALLALDRVLVLQPEYAEAYYNRGFALARMGLLEEAMSCYLNAVRIKPDYVDARIQIADVHLMRGELAQGFEQYVVRRFKRTPPHSDIREFKEPQWLGDASLEHKTILLYAEQGLGDTIQFCRYARKVEELGAKVLLEVQLPLVSLMHSLGSRLEIIERGTALPPIDYQCPLLSLPAAFKTNLQTIPAATPYLFADTAKVHKWRELVGAKRKSVRAGLVWSGNAAFIADDLRSLTFRQILNIDEGLIEFICLQKELRAEDRSVFEKQCEIRFFGDLLEDFSDTAGLIEQMDLVVTTDTSVAHLAAALGKPTWMLISKAADWRWLLLREDSPWYPTMLLFRQRREETDWLGVFERVRRALRSL